MRILKFALAALAFSWFASQELFSQHHSPSPCDDPQTQTDINICSQLEYEEADRILNETYKQLMEQLSDESKVKVRDAQRLWLKYRDAHCNFASSLYEGGSMQPMVHNACLTELTRDRTRALQDLLDTVE